jgi:hypothetical protein
MIANVNHRSMMTRDALQSRNINVATNGFDHLKTPVRIHGPHGAVQTASAGRKSGMKERIAKPEVIKQTWRTRQIFAKKSGAGLALIAKFGSKCMMVLIYIHGFNYLQLWHCQKPFRFSNDFSTTTYTSLT